MQTFIGTISKTWPLTTQLVIRDVAGRYRGSQLGLAWTVINPLLMLAVYTVVFSQVFRARWGAGIEAQSQLTFALNLFVGLVVFNFFAECATRSSALITGNPNYVKKVVFPLHVLGNMVTGSAFVHALTSTCILLVVELVVNGSIPLTALALPIVWLPLALGCLGMSWILSTIGVFLRDIGQVMNAGVSMLMFLSPVFYPVSALPNNLKWLGAINPLASIIEQSRDVVMNGTMPNLGLLLAQIAVALIWCEICMRVLTRAQPHFGDML